MIELDYLCDVCGGRVPDSGGCLQVFFEDIRSFRAADDEWRKVHSSGPHTLAQLISGPVSVPWQIFHDRCHPRPGSDGYDIDVREVRTWRDLLKATARLMEKNWLELTDWRYVIGAAADGSGRRIVAVDVRGEVA